MNSGLPTLAFAGLCLAVAAIPLSLILSAPVMREPTVVKALQTHTEWVCHIDRERFADGWHDVEKCNEEVFAD